MVASEPERYNIIFSKQAEKDKKLLKQAGLDNKAKSILDKMLVAPFFTPPPSKALQGNLKGVYARRINVQHRMTYTVDEEAYLVKILRMWTHYER